MFKDFDGAAGVVRFADGAVEAEFTAKGLPDSFGAVGGDAGPDVTHAAEHDGRRALRRVPRGLARGLPRRRWTR